MSCFSDGLHIKHVTRAIVNPCTWGGGGGGGGRGITLMLNVSCATSGYYHLSCVIIMCDCHVTAM